MHVRSAAQFPRTVSVLQPKAAFFLLPDADHPHDVAVFFTKKRNAIVRQVVFAFFFNRHGYICQNHLVTELFNLRQLFRGNFFVMIKIKAQAFVRDRRTALMQVGI